MEYFPFYLALVIIIMLLVMLADRIRVAYPVLLVVAGLLISLVPGVPVLHVDPHLIFILFLPPLLYDAAFAISWKELWRWRRIIGSFAFLVVFFTALAVAFFANWIIPGFSLALGFLLGGIVSPPDAVSASAILKFVKVPRRMSSILEGESLLNDASSLIIFRFALIAVGTGQFIWFDATLSFVWMVLGGAAIGTVIGWIFMKAHKLLPTDANMDIVLTLVAPYIMYITAEEVHSSGVLAVVAGGLFLSVRRHVFLTSTSRLRGSNVWASLVFVLNGLVFMIIGLDLPEIVTGLKSEGVGVPAAIGYGLLITLVLMVVRFIACYGALVTTLIMRNFIQVADRNPGMRAPLALSWTGMRGVVSLAAALSIPVQVSDGVPFPHRNLILFVTFIVIITTLLVQGLTLPYVIRKIALPDFNDYLPDEEADRLITRQLAQHTTNYLNTQYADQLQRQRALQHWASKWNDNAREETATPITEADKAVYLDVLAHQRDWLLARNRDDNTIDEEVIRRHVQRIDLEEEKIKLL